MIKIYQSYSPPEIINANKHILTKNYLDTIAKHEIPKYYSQPSKNLRIISYNLNSTNFCKYQDKKLKADLQSMKPDIIGIIEYNPGWKLTGYQRKYFPCDSTYGIGVFWKEDKVALHRIKCLNLDEGNTVYEKRLAVHCQFQDRKGKILNLFFLHLDVYDHSGKRRLRETNYLLKYINTHKFASVLLMGDFNAQDLGLYSSSLGKKYHQEHIARTRLPVPNLVFSQLYSNGFLNLLYLLIRNKRPQWSCWSNKLVDHALIKNKGNSFEWKIHSLDYLYWSYSDHLPIVVELN